MDFVGHPSDEHPRKDAPRSSHKATVPIVTGLIASAILPPSSPPLLPSGTVEYWLPQLLVDFVVRLAEPVAEFVSARSLDLLLLDILLEVFGADPAGVELGKKLHEACQIVLLRGCGCLGVCRGYGVKEGPATPAEGFDVCGTIVGWLCLLRLERRLGLRRPGRECGTGCAGAATRGCQC